MNPTKRKAKAKQKRREARMHRNAKRRNQTPVAKDDAVWLARKGLTDKQA